MAGKVTFNCLASRNVELVHRNVKKVAKGSIDITEFAGVLRGSEYNPDDEKRFEPIIGGTP